MTDQKPDRQGGRLPTKQMIKAGGRAINPEPNSHGMNDGIYEAAAKRCWKAMSATAPPTRDGAEGVVLRHHANESLEEQEYLLSKSAPPKPAPDAWGRKPVFTTAVAAELVPFIGLDERLDRLCLTAKDGSRFILSTESAKNIVGIVREWIRVRLASHPVRGDREAFYSILTKHYTQDATLDAVWQELKEMRIVPVISNIDAEAQACLDMLILCGDLGGKQPNETYPKYLRRLIDFVTVRAEQ